MKNTEMITTKDAARILGISVCQVCVLIREKKLPAQDMRKTGTKKPRWEIREDDLYNFKEVYKKHGRNCPTIHQKVIEKPVTEEPVHKAFVKKERLTATYEYKRNRLKEEFKQLKERMLEIVIEMEELENHI